jgi:hypothetical protein
MTGEREGEMLVAFHNIEKLAIHFGHFGWASILIGPEGHRKFLCVDEKYFGPIGPIGQGPIKKKYCSDKKLARVHDFNEKI